ncbi:MAG: phage major capsid protein, partial [Actinobacteria bacterium]|nr:phage major capsid protein [Actinomycetota bacterium]
MPTLGDLITRAEKQKAEAIAERDSLKPSLSDYKAREGRLTDAELTRAAALVQQKAHLDGRIDGLVEQIRTLRAEEAADREVERLAQQSFPTSAGEARSKEQSTMTTSSVRVTESRTYRREQIEELRSRGTGYSFLTDLYRAQILGDPTASERLARHGEEVRVEQPGMYERAVNTGGVGAFVPPQYLAELWAEFARAGRPVADLCNRSIPLPAEGMTVAVPRVTTASTTAVQASENASVSNTDLDETTLSVPVVTIAGYTDVSRQAIERGALVEAMLFADLAADYNAKLDAQIINGSGTSGQHLGLLGVSGINSITYTDASPTIPEAWPKLADAVGRVISTRFTGPTAIVMRPNAWAWFMSATDST